MINWVKSSGVIAYQRNGQISLTKLNSFGKVNVEKSNTCRFIDRNLSNCQDLHWIKILEIFRADVLLAKQTKESHEDAAPHS